MSKNAVLACTIGQSGCLGSDSTKDFCSLIRGANRDEGRSCAGTPDGPSDHLSRSALRLPANTAQRQLEARDSSKTAAVVIAESWDP